MHSSIAPRVFSGKRVRASVAALVSRSCPWQVLLSTKFARSSKPLADHRKMIAAQAASLTALQSQHDCSRSACGFTASISCGWRIGRSSSGVLGRVDTLGAGGGVHVYWCRALHKGTAHHGADGATGLGPCHGDRVLHRRVRNRRCSWHIPPANPSDRRRVPNNISSCDLPREREGCSRKDDLRRTPRDTPDTSNSDATTPSRSGLVDNTKLVIADNGGCRAVRESRAVICDHPERQWDSGVTRRSFACVNYYRRTKSELQAQAGRRRYLRSAIAMSRSTGVKITC